MAATVEKQLLGSLGSLLTTELNSLAASAWTAAGPVYNNTIGQTGDGYTLALCEAAITLAANPTAGSGFNLFLAKSSAGLGVTFEDVSTATVTNNRAPDLFIPYTGGQVSTFVVLPIWLPPGQFKGFGQNTDASHALAASGNTIKITPFTREMV